MACTEGTLAFGSFAYFTNSEGPLISEFPKDFINFFFPYFLLLTCYSPTLDKMPKYIILEILALQVFLGANAQLLGTSLAGAKMP